MSKTKQLVILSLLMALQVVISMQYIPVGENLRIYFTYLVVVIVAAVFPIKIALAYAAIEDIVAFIAFPSGPFFLGYTLTAVASMLIYSLCLYRHVSIKRIIIAKTMVNILVNVGLNSIWSAMLYSKGYIYYLAKSFIKNITLLPFEIILIIIFLKIIKPLLIKNGISYD